MTHPAHLAITQEATRGQRAAERLAQVVGSWSFLIVQTAIIVLWMTLNVVAWVRNWDPYPFILLNLCLSLQAAYTGPMLLIASNRQSEIDRRVAAQTYEDTEGIKALLAAWDAHQQEHAQEQSLQTEILKGLNTLLAGGKS